MDEVEFKLDVTIGGDGDGCVISDGWNGCSGSKWMKWKGGSSGW